jgi:hypothetical protein
MHRSLSVLVLGAALTLLNGAAVAEPQFDGEWSVVASPEKGICKRARRYSVMVENGIIRTSATKREGRVQPGGRIHGSVEVDRSRVNVTGSLSERSGSGTWAVSGRINCSGRWSAEKRN